MSTGLDIALATIAAIGIIIVALRIRAIRRERQTEAEQHQRWQDAKKAERDRLARYWAGIQPRSKPAPGTPDWRVRLPGQHTLIRATQLQYQQAELCGLERKIEGEQR